MMRNTIGRNAMPATTALGIASELQAASVTGHYGFTAARITDG